MGSSGPTGPANGGTVGFFFNNTSPLTFSTETSSTSGTADGHHFTIASPSGKTIQGIWQITANTILGHDCTGVVSGLTDGGVAVHSGLVGMAHTDSPATLISYAPFTIKLQCSQPSPGVIHTDIVFSTTDTSTTPGNDEYTSV